MIRATPSPIITGGFRMSIFYLRCRSVTYAQRAVKLLEKYGIPGIVVKLPQRLSDEGCGYSIRVSGQWLEQAKQALADAGFEIKNIYGADKNGDYREVRL